MRITRARVVALVFVVIVAVLLANFISSINVDEAVVHNSISKGHPNNIPIIDGSREHIMWFAQVILLFFI